MRNTQLIATVGFSMGLIIGIPVMLGVPVLVIVPSVILLTVFLMLLSKDGALTQPHDEPVIELK